MKNTEKECFEWCITRALNPVDNNADRITNAMREQSTKINWNGMKFPVEFHDIDKFERLNPVIVMNVYTNINESCEISPLRISKVDGIYINLLLYKQHYTVIKDFGRLVNSQLSKNENKGFHCFRCRVCF